ncbi:MAG: hypothetical protein HRU26_06915 [Psychroserpens sp.]|nr:hypothetical protein [Psychroserpens sp.]
MTNLTKDELIALAELCGYRIDENNVLWHSAGGTPLDWWQPDEKIQQAMEVLKAFMISGMWSYGFEFACIYHDNPILGFWFKTGAGDLGQAEGESKGWEIDKMFCECICQAVLKALKEANNEL